MKKQPEITAQTKQKLMDSFWTLASNKGIRRVTVSAVTKSAGVNRSTFYEYFSDIDELLEHSENEILLDMCGTLEQFFAEGRAVNIHLLSEKMLKTISGYDDKFFLLLGKNGDPRFIAKFREKLSTQFFPVIISPQMKPYAEYIVAYMVSAMTGILTYWYDTGRTITLDELSGIVRGLAAKGLSAWTELEIKK